MSAEEEKTRDRYVNRRKMAWRSFYAFSGMGTALVLLGLWRPDLVTGVWPQAMFVMGLWGTVVAGYFTVTWNTDKAEVMRGRG